MLSRFASALVAHRPAPHECAHVSFERLGLILHQADWACEHSLVQLRDALTGQRYRALLCNKRSAANHSRQAGWRDAGPS